jgi:hypothetical protein
MLLPCNKRVFFSRTKKGAKEKVSDCLKNYVTRLLMENKPIPLQHYNIENDKGKAEQLKFKVGLLSYLIK